MSEDRGFKSTDCRLLPTKNLARPLPQLYRQWILQEATEGTEEMTFPLITRISADRMMPPEVAADVRRLERR